MFSFLIGSCLVCHLIIHTSFSCPLNDGEGGKNQEKESTGKKDAMLSNFDICMVESSVADLFSLPIKQYLSRVFVFD
jgi:hypothetical protein